MKPPVQGSRLPMSIICLLVGGSVACGLSLVIVKTPKLDRVHVSVVWWDGHFFAEKKRRIDLERPVHVGQNLSATSLWVY